MTSAKYEELVSSLTDANVALRDANGEFRSTYDILYDLAQVWPSLTNDVQAALTTAIAGTRQQDVFSSIINQFQEAEGAMETMADSAGTLQDSYDEFMESTTAHINQFKAAVQELSSDLFSSDMMNGLIDIGTGLINMLDALIDHLGSLGTVAAITASMGFIKGVIPAIKSFAEAASIGIGSVKDFGAAIQLAFSNLDKAAQTSLIVTAISAVIFIIVELTRCIQNHIKTLDDLKDALDSAVSTYESEVSTLEDYESQLEDIRDRMEEIQSMGEISITEEEELEQLRLESEELEHQIALQKEKAALAAKDVLEAAGSAFDATVSSQYISDDDTYSFDPMTGVIAANFVSTTVSPSEEMHAAMDAYYDYENRREEIYRRMRDLEESVEGDITELSEEDQNVYDILNTQYDNLTQNMDKARSRALEMAEFEESQSEAYSTLAENGDITFIGSVEWETLKNDLNTYYDFLDDISDETEDAVENIVSETASMDETVANIFENLRKDAVDALGELNVDTENEMEHYNNMLSQIEELYPQLQDYYDSLPDEDKEVVYNFLLNIDEASWKTLDDFQADLQNYIDDQILSYTIDIEAETTSLGYLTSALSDTSEAAGVTAEEVENLQTRYKDLDSENLSKLFTSTASGIRVNTQAAQELESEYQALVNTGLEDKMELLIQKWYEAQNALAGLTEADEGYNEALANVNGLDAQISETAMLIAQFDALNSSYSAWQTAQSNGNNYDTWEDIGNGYESVQDLIDRGWRNADDVTTYLDMLLGEGWRNDFVDAEEAFNSLTKTIEGTNHNLMDYFTYDADGNLVSDGLIDMIEDLSKLDSEIATYNAETGEWNLDLQGENIEKAADYLGTTTEVLRYALLALMDVTDNVEFEDLTDRYRNAAAEALGLIEGENGAQSTVIDVGFEVDWNNVEDVQKAIDKLFGDYNAYIVSGGEDEETIKKYEEDIEHAMQQKLALEQPSVFEVNAEYTGLQNEELGEITEDLQRLYLDYGQLEIDMALGHDTEETQAAIDDVWLSLSQIDELEDLLISIGVEAEDASAIAETAAAYQEAADNDEIEFPSTVDADDLQEALNSAFNSIDNDTVEVAIEEGAGTEDTLSKIQAIEEELDNLDNGEYSFYIESNVEEVLVALEGIQELASNFDISGLDEMTLGDLNVDAVMNTRQAMEGFVEVESWVFSDKPILITTNAEDVAKTLDDLEAYSFSTKHIRISTNASQVILDLDNVQKSLDAIDTEKTITIHQNTITSGDTEAAGTAHATGTAKDSGDWGTKSGGTALGGEIGQELVVRDGKWFTVGDDTAEFFQYEKGDIIFNADQTEQIFKYGKIKNGNRRGESYAEGTAFASSSGGTASSGSGKTKSNVGVTSTGSAKSSSSSSSSSSSTSSTTTTSTSTSDGSTVNTTTTVEDDDTEIIDWIEIAIDRIERSIDHLASIAESSYKTLKTRLSATDDEISAIMEEISTQQSAYNRYIQQANSVGLSSSLATLVQNGAIDIKEYDADTADLISDYQEWYEKALDCKDAINELNETLAELYESKFENIATDYENQLSLIEHLTNTYNNNLSDVYKLNLDNYTELIKTEKQNVSTLNKELKDLQDAMDEALASGTIQMGSEAWYGMAESVNEVKEAIQEATIAIGEFYAEEMNAIQAVSDNNETILDNIKTMVENLMGTTYAYDPRDYTYLTVITEQQLKEAESNVEDLKRIYEEAMASGYVEMYSSEWYDMVNQILEAEIAVQEYENAIKDLPVQKFDDLASSLDNLISKYEHLENLANLHLSDVFALDMNNYNKIINSIYATQYDLIEEYTRLKEIFDDAVSSGAVAMDSEDYYSMLSTLNSLEEQIMQTTIDLGDTFKSEFDAIGEEFDRQSSLLDHLTNTYNNAISDAEAHGYMLSTQYYKAMQGVQDTYLDSLYAELDDLTQKMSDAVNSGTIEEGSAAWVEMQVAINGVKEEIQETTTSVQELNNEIRDLEWSYFDYGQDRISQLTQEADFLISLMNNSDLYTDKGQLTDTGMATMGLHGQNYDVYMAQADAYGQELLEINKQLAEDPYNTDLIERREELLKLQQQSILAAEDEKDAIVDMVEEGIRIELEALQDLIDAYKDSLNAAKDLHDYEKSVSSQASDIATIQKQLQAYAGDTSEETRATIQKLTSDLADAEEELAETQYEHLIDETEKLLDNLYDEYEETLNKRLDDIDALILDMIDMINGNSADIYTTLNDVSDSVGYALGEGGGVYEAWASAAKGIENAISSYDVGNMLDNSATGLAIQGICNYIKDMEEAADATAESIIGSATTTTAATTPSFAIGDVNGDGLINESDVSQLLKYVHGDNVSIDTAAADINGDGVVNSADYNILQQVVGGAYSSIDEAVEAYKKANGLTDTTTSTTSSGTLLGDVNGDGTINITDLQALMKYNNGQNVAIDKTAADVNKDGSINITDYQLLLKYIQGEISSFASGGLVDFTGLAQLDGTKQSPEMVLSPEDTENFIALRDAMESLSNTGGLQDLINNKEALFEHMTNVSTPPDIDNEVTKDISFEINIPIDHVQDYNDFVNQLRDDTKFEKLIKSMSIDQAIGKSSLAKYKYAWN